MIDISLVRDNPEAIKAVCKNKNADLASNDIDKLLQLDHERRDLQQQIDKLRTARNKHATMFKGEGPTSQENVAKGRGLKRQLVELEDRFNKVEVAYLGILKQIPNIPTDDVPIGSSEDDNVVVKTVGKPPKFKVTPKNHMELTADNGLIDKERAAKVSGARFVFLKGQLVRLQFALVQFGLAVLTDEKVLQQIAKDAKLKVSSQPFTPVLPPLMIRTDMFEAMDRLDPRDDRYKMQDDDLWLQGSAEHVLGAMHADEIIPEAELPLRYAGWATSFRREAGTYGKDTEGILRMHQFDKLELESFTAPEDALSEHLFMIAIQEYLMQQLELPYQIVMKSTADIGKPNARGVDIEAWMPGQDKYRETHTADYMTDYQARRLGIRLRRPSGDLELVHTNDATAFAAGRLMIALLENHQDEHGTVHIPTALQSYYGGKTL